VGNLLCGRATYIIQADNGFVTLEVGRRDLFSVLENMVPVPLKMTLVCKPKIVTRKFLKFKNEKLTMKLRWIYFCNSISEI
jgi:hypothetical protein